MTDEELIARWDDYVESMGSVMGEVEHMAQQMRVRIEALVKDWQKDGEEILYLRERAERLEAAMIQMRDDRTGFRHAVHFRRFITATLMEGAKP